MTPATLTALAAELRTLAGPDLIAAAQQAAAILEQVAGADAVPDFLSDTDVARIRRKVYGGPRFDTCEREFAAEIEAAVRAQFFAALTAQSGEGVALYEALKAMADIGALEEGMLGDHGGIPVAQATARAAIAAYEAKRGGVR